ncbi:ATP-binding protein [Stieleria sp. TO1_6]|uniref:ATP-binding protein n=1 Tax=Stieleria tagensis TaxID=2956795 RepID=UPI00209B6799|nr:ATP-binding protein [Stieleria tagensis]MCO8120924.1 ATP-binding protein [Stieleria tagensis]
MNASFAFQPSNPFSTKCVAPSQVVYRFTHGASGTSPHTVDSHLEAVLAQLRTAKRGLILGPHGTGKSTLLHTFLPKLQRSYPKVAFHQLCNDPNIPLRKRIGERMRASRRIRADLKQLPPQGLIMIDGWEQLSHLSRWRIAKSASSNKLTILATAHHRIPGWTTVHETCPSEKLIRSLAGDLLHDSPYEIRKLVDNQLKNRPVTPKTNVRDLWFELYDMVEDAQANPLKFNA